MRRETHTETGRARDAYEQRDIYAPHKICLKAQSDPKSYADRLLADKVAVVRQYYNGGPVLDLCCAVGEHLLTLGPDIDEGYGLDFSSRYLVAARGQAIESGVPNVRFVQGDAKAIPFACDYFSLIYSFSSLYAILEVQTVIQEIGRALRPGGIAVLDLGNKRSLNTYCLKFYNDWPQTYPITTREMKQHLTNAGLRILEHRCFQILPLWAGLPKQLWPLLHPIWRDIMRLRIGGRMLDEWISSMPIARRFAFRHLIVCRKPESR